MYIYICMYIVYYAYCSRIRVFADFRMSSVRCVVSVMCAFYYAFCEVVSLCYVQCLVCVCVCLCVLYEVVSLCYVQCLVCVM